MFEGVEGSTVTLQAQHIFSEMEGELERQASS